MADINEESNLSHSLSCSIANTTKKGQKSRENDSSLSLSCSVLSSVHRAASTAVQGITHSGKKVAKAMKKGTWKVV
jgi:hypothetical protein